MLVKVVFEPKDGALLKPKQVSLSSELPIKDLTSIIGSKIGLQNWTGYG